MSLDVFLHQSQMHGIFTVFFCLKYNFNQFKQMETMNWRREDRREWKICNKSVNWNPLWWQSHCCVWRCRWNEELHKLSSILESKILCSSAAWLQSETPTKYFGRIVDCSVWLQFEMSFCAVRHSLCLSVRKNPDCGASLPPTEFIHMAYQKSNNIYALFNIAVSCSKLADFPTSQPKSKIARIEENFCMMSGSQNKIKWGAKICVWIVENEQFELF